MPPVICCTMRPLSYSNRPSACEVTNLKKVALSTLMCALTFTRLLVLGLGLWLESHDSTEVGWVERQRRPNTGAVRSVLGLRFA